LREFDLSVAYACAAGTSKPIGTGFNDPEHVAEAVAMFDAMLGGEGRFRKRLTSATIHTPNTGARSWRNRASSPGKYLMPG
jgi:trimethylamine:corrinoid methyltransferase-like protein